jgi:hypothetical protein
MGVWEKLGAKKGEQEKQGGNSSANRTKSSDLRKEINKVRHTLIVAGGSDEFLPLDRTSPTEFSMTTAPQATISIQMYHKLQIKNSKHTHSQNFQDSGNNSVRTLFGDTDTGRWEIFYRRSFMAWTNERNPGPRMFPSPQNGS